MDTSISSNTKKIPTVDINGNNLHAMLASITLEITVEIPGLRNKLIRSLVQLPYYVSYVKLRNFVGA